jgi:dipeptidyl aminopeptidase/acylaminoacyl peptidase
MSCHRLRGVSVVLALSLSSVSAFADDASVIPIADFARHSQLGIPSMSPDGQYLAVSVHDKSDAEGGSKYEIGVFHLPEMKPVSRIDMEPQVVPVEIVWTSNTRLLVVPAKETGTLEVPQLTGDLVAADYDGKNQQSMFGWRAQSRHGIPPYPGVVSGLPSRRNGHFYWTISGEGIGGVAKKGETEVFDVDAETGAAKLRGDINVSDMEFVFHDGSPILAYGVDGANKPILFRHRTSDPRFWDKIPISASHMKPLRTNVDDAVLYWSYSADGGANVLASTDLENFSEPKVIARDDFGSVDDIQWTPAPHKPFAAVVNVGRPRTIYVDDDNWATVHKALSQQYPDYQIDFAGMSEDGSRILVYGVSDRDPGFFALFNLDPVSLTPLFRVEPWIHPAKMAKREPIRFKASDGVVLDGYLTRPANRTNLGMVLLPHGGPLYVRDEWSYDEDAQFLASRGYAVLQVNYRGSSGRGSNFAFAGYKKFNTGIQQDLLDGVTWAIDKGYADKNRICVYGASFGGYSALWDPILAPGMFKCAVDFAGISDYAIEFDDSDTQQTERGRNYFEQAVGTDKNTIKAVSPIYHLDQFNVPVLIVHGEKDPRVPLKNATELRDALDKAGKPYEYLVKPKELHGFYSEANNEDFLQHMQTFLAKYIGS